MQESQEGERRGGVVSGRGAKYSHLQSSTTPPLHHSITPPLSVHSGFHTPHSAFKRVAERFSGHPRSSPPDFGLRPGSPRGSATASGAGRRCRWRVFDTRSRRSPSRTRCGDADTRGGESTPQIRPFAKPRDHSLGSPAPATRHDPPLRDRIRSEGRGWQLQWGQARALLRHNPRGSKGEIIHLLPCRPL